MKIRINATFDSVSAIIALIFAWKFATKKPTEKAINRKEKRWPLSK